MARLPAIVCSDGQRRSSATHSACERPSFQRIAGRSGRPSSSSSVAPCIWPDSPIPRTRATSRGWRAARSSTAPTAASTQPSGSCSDHSGAGCDSASSRAAVATTAPASLTSTAFTPDVPMSIPRYTPSSLSPVAVRELKAALSATGRFELHLPLRQIVPHHDVDPDLLLFAQDRLATGEREQHAHGGARFVSGVLRDRGMHHALQQQPAGQRGDIVSDEHHLLVWPRIAERLLV